MNSYQNNDFIMKTMSTYASLHERFIHQTATLDDIKISLQQLGFAGDNV